MRGSRGRFLLNVFLSVGFPRHLPVSGAAPINMQLWLLSAHHHTDLNSCCCTHLVWFIRHCGPREPSFWALLPDLAIKQDLQPEAERLEGNWKLSGKSCHITNQVSGKLNLRGGFGRLTKSPVKWRIRAATVTATANVNVALALALAVTVPVHVYINYNCKCRCNS